MPASNPVSWVCDTDWFTVEGWVDSTGGELCNLYYRKKVWRDGSSCVSYQSQTVIYGLALRLFTPNQSHALTS